MLDSVFKWLIKNKEWLFSGVATTALFSVLGLFWKYRGMPKKSRGYINPTENGEKPNSVDNLFFKYTELSKQSMQLKNLTESDLDIELRKQYSAHPLLIYVDYESLPIPLNSSVFVVVSKTSSKCLIEDVITSVSDQSLFTSWNKLRNAYFKAIALSFRNDHNMLFKQGEIKKTLSAISDLDSAAANYYAHCSFRLSKADLKWFHELKQRIASAHGFLQLLSEGVENEKLNCGTTAVQIEMAISSVHKILLDGRLSGNYANNLSE